MIIDFGSFTRRGLLANLDRSAEIWGVGGGGEAGEETVKDRKTTDLSAVRE